MRVIARKERPHPGAQLRLTDADGHRSPRSPPTPRRGQLPDLELRHRRRARCEDRIRNSKDTGLTNLPLHDFSQNQIWCAIVALAVELTAWMQMLTLTGTTHAGGNPNAYGYACSASPRDSRNTAGNVACTYQHTPPGQHCSPG